MSEKRRRTIARPVRLDPDEAAIIGEKLAATSKTFSLFARDAMLGVRIRTVSDARFAGELARLAGLLKKVHTDSNGAYNDETAEILRQIKQSLRRHLDGDIQGSRKAK